MSTVNLLIGEKDVKGLFPDLVNLGGQYLAASMFEAQEIGLKSIIGSSLLRSLKEHQEAGDWQSYPLYASLKEECKFYLVYRSVAGVIPRISYKIRNAGVAQTSDTNVANVSREVTDANVEEYTSKADFFAFELEKWLVARIDFFPELREGDGEEIRANLYSAASCGIFLGGARGQRL